MAQKDYSAARVREVPLGVQFFLFIVLSQALKYFALMNPGPVEGTSAKNLALIAGCFLPFALARIPPLVAVLPPVFLRREARIDVLAGGIVYTFDGVKRPLFVEWPDLEAIERGRWGLTLRVRNRANLTEAMPAYQAEFWRKRIVRPIRLVVVDRFAPVAALAPALAAAQRAGVRVSGFAGPEAPRPAAPGPAARPGPAVS